MVGLIPNLTIVLDVPNSLGAARLLGRGGTADRYERLDAAFHARVNAGFRAIAAAAPERCVVVPADRGIEAVHAAVMAAVEQRLLGAAA